MTSKEAFARLIESIEVYDESIGLTKDDLWSLGLRFWSMEEGTEKELWLFPHSYYEHIPVGFPIVFMGFKKGEFMPGATDRDLRFGCLTFGILGTVKP